MRPNNPDACKMPLYYISYIYYNIMQASGSGFPGKTTTNICDLPDNVTGLPPPSMFAQQPPGQDIHIGGGGGGQPALPGNNYMTINAHPNPYGNPTFPGIMPLPAQQPPRNDNKVNYLATQELMMGGMGGGSSQQYPLPSRDMYIDPTTIMQDEQVQANYIPRPSAREDYVRDYQKQSQDRIQQNEEKKHRERLFDTIFTEIQTPVLVAVLYFIFQMPFVSNMLIRYFSFMALYDENGNTNFLGLALKSVLFGSFFYSIMRASYFLSEL